jgi:hypothetical protein
MCWVWWNGTAVLFVTHIQDLESYIEMVWKFIKVYLPTDAEENCLKRILKFTLKQLWHISV